MTDDERNTITKDEYLIRVKKQAVEMQQQLYHALSAEKNQCVTKENVPAFLQVRF
ncbi:MAG: hypothetical protein IJD82_04755 [Clostridia bacterium]|nr:hypothetical protein [Clostridia bacterium]